MAKKLDVKLSLSKTGIPPSSARLFVDYSGDGFMQPSEEVALGTANGADWVGTINPPARKEKTFFHLKFTAPKGATWTFTISDGENELLKFEDKMLDVMEQVHGKF